MKGLSHFVVGVAAASFFPVAVQAGADGNPLYFILGGMFGLLPDTLDFKLYRFLYRHDVEVQPDPLAPDPEAIATAIAHAVECARSRSRPYRIKLNTVRLGPDLWQRYYVDFDVAGKRVKVEYGQHVSTGGKADEDGPVIGPSAMVGLSGDLKLEYQSRLTIDAFEGPLLEMRPSNDGRIVPAFIPWHRQWSHSLVIGLAFSLLVTALLGPLAGMISLLAYAAHIGADQLGYMGSNCFFPFSKKRIAGLGITHSGDAFPNFSTVWISCLLIFWNLSRAVPGGHDPISLVKLLFFMALLPLGLYHVMLKRNSA